MLGMVSSDGVQVGLDLLELLFQAGHLSRAARLPSWISSCFLAGSFSLGMSLAISFCRCWMTLRLLDEPLALVVELDDAVHVGLDVAVGAVGFDGVEVVADEVCVEHGDPVKRSIAKTQRPQEKHRARCTS